MEQKLSVLGIDICLSRTVPFSVLSSLPPHLPFSQQSEGAMIFS